MAALQLVYFLIRASLLGGDAQVSASLNLFVLRLSPFIFRHLYSDY